MERVLAAVAAAITIRKYRSLSMWRHPSAVHYSCAEPREKKTTQIIQLVFFLLLATQ
jgi:hypothetical protein